MSLRSATPLSSRARFGFGALAALLVGGMIALGVSAPSFAGDVSTQPVTETIKVVNKAGTPLPGSDVYAVPVADGVEVAGGAVVTATAVTSKPGYFSASLEAGQDYTLEIDPTGTARVDGTWEYLGGGEDLDEAETFVPSSLNSFVTATFSTEGVITGKVTSPTGVALKGTEVEDFMLEGDQWLETSVTTTGSTGLYTLTDLQPGSYKLKFLSATDLYPPVYSGGVTSLDAATAVSLTAGKTLTVNAKFVTFTGVISGNAQILYDGEPYGDEDAIATAYPVTAQEAGAASQVDFSRGVSSARVNSRGAWSIGNVAPGTYVVYIEPEYYNEAGEWVGASDSSLPLSSATVITVASGQKVAEGTSYLSANDYSGAQPNIYVGNSNDTAGIPGAIVSIYSEGDGYEYLEGTAGEFSDEPTELTFEDGVSVDYDKLQPGWYTVDVVDPTGAHEPYSEDAYFTFGSNNLQISLANASPVPSFTAQPTIAQTDLQVGSTYTVAGETTARSDATLSYQWLRDGKPIYGAAGSSFTSTGADLGAQVSVRVTASSFGFRDVYAIATVAGTETPGAAATNTGDAPSITPATAAYVGTVLQAHVGDWSTTGLKFHYQWQSNGANVGTDSATYVVALADQNEPVTVTVTATKTGYDDSDAVTSASVTPVSHPAAVPTKAPVVTKTTVKGITTYAATAGTWSLTGLTYTYAWTVDGDPASSASSSAKLVLPAAAATWTDPLELTVTASKPGYVAGTKTLIVQKGTEAFIESVAPTVQDVESTLVVQDSDDVVHVGEHLTEATHANWSLASNSAAVPDNYGYQWFRQSTAAGKLPVAIVGATAATYVVSAADVGQLLSIRETAVSATHTGASVIAVAGIGTASQALVTSPASVTLRGVGAQGQVLTAAIGAWPTTTVLDTYQWVDCTTAAAAATTCDPDQPSTYLPIAKATKSTLTVLAGYGSLAVRVTGSKAGYVSETEFSAAASLKVATDIANLTPPTVVGAAHVGVKLTAVTGKFSVAAVVAHYEWQELDATDGTWVQAPGLGSNTSTYTPTAADLGASIRVEETATKTGYVDTDDANGIADDSASAVIAAGTIGLVKAPVLTATATAFTASAGSYTPTGGSAFVRWYTDGVLDNPTDPSDPSIVLTMPTRARNLTADAGKAIWATVTYSVDGYTSHVSTVIAQRGTITAASGDVQPESITGAAFGDVLVTAPLNPFTDAAGTTVVPTYQWYSNSVAIKGATASSFRPTTAYIAHHIQVKVTGTTALYLPLSVESGYSFVLGYGGLGDLTSPAVSYSGDLEPGTVMTSTPGTGYDASAVTLARYWQRLAVGSSTWVTIAKATAVTYTPVATDVGAQFRFELVSSKLGYGTQVQYSAPVTVLNSPTLATITPPVVSGVGAVGNVLTATPGTWNAAALTYSYQWYRDDVLIPGATAATFTPDFTDATDTLSFTVTASRVGYLPVTVTSNDQVIAVGTIPLPTIAPKIAVVSAAAGSYAVSTGSWAVDGLTFTYQWEVAGVDVDGATNDSYTRASSDGGLLSVVITAKRTGYAPFVTTANGPTLVAAH